MSRTHRALRLAVIDSGWRGPPDHPRLLEHRSCHRSFIPGSDPSDVYDTHGHGTMCAFRALECWPPLSLVVLKVLDERLEGEVQAILEALDWLSSRPVDLALLSLSMTDATHRADLAMLCKRLAAAGTVLIAAADRHTGAGWPASFSSVLGVRAGTMEQIRSFRYHPDLPIELEAHGGGTLLSRPPEVANSYAAATMAGIAARLLDENGERGIDALRGLLTRGRVHGPSPFWAKSGATAGG